MPETPRDELPDDYLRALGRIVVNFARLEHFLRVSIIFLLGDDQRIGSLVTAELSMGQLLKVLSSLVRLRMHEASKLKEIDQLRIRAEKLDTRRGLIMHSSWAHPGHWADSSGVDPATHAMRTKTTAKVRKGLQYQFEHFTSDDLHQLADEIRQVSGKLLNFTDDLVKAQKEGRSPPFTGRA